MKDLLFLFFLLYTVAVYSQTHVISYVLNIEDGKIVKVSKDSLEKAARPLIHKENITIHYHNFTYFFKVEVMHDRDSWKYSPLFRTHHMITYYYGIATFLGNPYSVRMMRYGGHQALWIIPLMFNQKSDVHDLRAFFFTDDKRMLKAIQEDTSNIPIIER